MSSGNSHQVLGERTSTNTHVLLSALVFVLATPSFNPILLFCETMRIPSGMFTSLAVFFFSYTVYMDLPNVTYYCLRIFMNSIVSIFFRTTDVVGADNIPVNGPVIFTGNHSNQFVDGINVLCHARHKVGFLIAQKSWDSPVVGDFAKMAGCIPVQRPQDAAKKGTGEAIFDGTCTLKGEGTVFTKEVKEGDKVRVRGADLQLKVVAVVSDTELTLADLKKGEALPSVGKSAFDVLERVDQAEVFTKVFDFLKDGASLGIFPEGGSHDRTELLPLKPGVAIIAMGALERHGISVPIVPVGLNYFEGHKFRGRCVVEFGPPITISGEVSAAYKEDKRKGCNMLLEQIEEGIKSCLCLAPTYEELELLYMTRRLYCRDRKLKAADKQDLNRRFAHWYNFMYKPMLEKGEVPPQLEIISSRIRAYRDSLSLLGLRDYQVRHLDAQPWGKIMMTICHMVFVMMLAAMPGLLLNAPVGLYARMVTDKHQVEALAKSNVKLKATDVRLSKMITTCIAGVPVLWLSYAIIIFCFGYKMKEVALFLFCCPFFSYLGVLAAEAGMVDLKDLKPLLLRLMVNREEMMKLMKERQELQKMVRATVKKYGPDMGEVYFGRNISWANLAQVTRSLFDQI
mmetsp:Transcript_89861/g.256936  ORF Transcript_89861/g.256936 Transcript_89861/m.256936 type:complete len:626 (-) Transcript_89861:586-2463(-)